MGRGPSFWVLLLLVPALPLTAGCGRERGLSYALENSDRVKTFALGGGHGCVEPGEATVQDGSYPLSRPLLMYVRADALQQVEVDAFLSFVVDDQRTIARQAQFVPLTDEQAARTRTVLEGAGIDVEDE